EVPIAPQTDPSPRPSPSTIIPDSIPESFGGNLGGHSSSDKSLSGNEGEMTLQSVYDLCLSLCAQSMAAKCLLKAQIGKKEILKEIMGAQRVYDEIIAKVLLNMSQAKAVSREKEKGVELKDIEETDRPRPTSTRSLRKYKPCMKRLRGQMKISFLLSLLKMKD
ncbi:hypothetical protein Tco_0074415, partial [Tanacetum coccineum]